PVRHSPKIVEVVNDAPDPYRSRVTLSMPYLRSVPNRWAFILGREKRGLVRRLLSGDLLPVHDFAPTRWFIDQAALDVDSSEKHP
ncbi:MAG: 6-phosphogluconolactonase, partial [Actinomycetota bacterium]